MDTNFCISRGYHLVSLCGHKNVPDLQPNDVFLTSVVVPQTADSYYIQR